MTIPMSETLVERLRAPAFWCCESDEGHPGDATALVHEATDHISSLERQVGELTSALEALLTWDCIPARKEVDVAWAALRKAKGETDG